MLVTAASATCCITGETEVRALDAVADIPLQVREAVSGDISAANMAAYAEESGAAVSEDHTQQAATNGPTPEIAATHAPSSGM